MAEPDLGGAGAGTSAAAGPSATGPGASAGDSSSSGSGGDETGESVGLSALLEEGAVAEGVGDVVGVGDDEALGDETGVEDVTATLVGAEAGEELGDWAETSPATAKKIRARTIT